MDDKGQTFLEQEVKRLRQYREDLEARLVELREEIYVLQEENAELAERCDEERLHRADLAEQENEELEARVQELEELFASDLGARVEQLEAENEALDTENWQLKDQLSVQESVGAGSLAGGSDEEPVYLASRNRARFHRPNCKWAQYILTSEALIEFGSHREAVEAGYKPCGTCRA